MIEFEYWLYWGLFKLFEIILFLFPAFPPTLSMRLVILLIYTIGHIYGIQTYYKVFKHNTLDSIVVKYANKDVISNEHI